MNFTLNNHLTYTLGGRPFGDRQTSLDKFEVCVGAVDQRQFEQGSFQSELHRTADAVWTQLGSDLVLFLSGGTDSEIVLRNFLAIGVKPRCAVIRFTNGLNAGDVWEAQEIAMELGVTLEVVDFDVREFYHSGEAQEFGDKLACSQITYLMVYRAIEKLGWPAVMGGEVVFSRKVSQSQSSWYMSFRENEDASAMRFSIMTGLPLVNEWFSYTPEAILHYLLDPEIQSLFTDTNYKLTSVSTKNGVLARLYPSVRPKSKTHGFERLLAFNHEAYRHLASNHIRDLTGSLNGIPVDTLIKQLQGNND